MSLWTRSARALEDGVLLGLDQSIDRAVEPRARAEPESQKWYRIGGDALPTRRPGALRRKLGRQVRRRDELERVEERCDVRRVRRRPIDVLQVLDCEERAISPVGESDECGKERPPHIAIDDGLAAEHVERSSVVCLLRKDEAVRGDTSCTRARVAARAEPFPGGRSVPDRLHEKLEIRFHYVNRSS